MYSWVKFLVETILLTAMNKQKSSCHVGYSNEQTSQLIRSRVCTIYNYHVFYETIFLQIVSLSLNITSDYSIKRIKTYHIHAHVEIRTSYKYVPIFITIKVPELCLKMAVIFSFIIAILSQTFCNRSTELVMFNKISAA